MFIRRDTGAVSLHHASAGDSPIRGWKVVWFKRIHAVVSCIWRRVGVGGCGLQPASFRYNATLKVSFKIFFVSG
ncbi:MAG: hypothetical protein AAB331_02175, partial [Planctomycetota bacterium]